MNRFLISVIFLASALLPMVAQKKGELSDAQREKYVAEIRQYKHDAIARELELTKEQQREFFPVYDDMEEQMMKLNNETRELERKAADNADATDAELEAAAIALYSQRLKEGQIEMAFYEKFSKILNNRQILRLKNTERKFTQRLMRHHRQAGKQTRAEDVSPQRQK